MLALCLNVCFSHRPLEGVAIS